MDKKKNVFIARQPIFDKDQNIFGYELLFRSGLENFFDTNLDQDYASSKMLMDTLLVFGFDELTRGRTVFLNFTKKVLLSDIATLFPKQKVVIELLEDIEPDNEVIQAFNNLKEQGYTLALDDFEYDGKYQPLLSLTDIIKVDFLLTKGEERAKVIQQINRSNIRYLAEKVETIEEFNQAINMGYSYFQGYFFSKPVIVSGVDMPAYKLHFLQIIQELYKPDVSIVNIERILMRDVSLSYKLMRLINSAAFSLRKEIYSIKHALNLLGIDELKKWISIMSISQVSEEKPEQLMITSISLAKFCETVAENTSNRSIKSNFFLAGLFNYIDAFLNRPMDEIVKHLPIIDEIKGALLGNNNIYRQVLDLYTYYEKMEWNQVTALCDLIRIDPENIFEYYMEAITWANKFQK